MTTTSRMEIISMASIKGSIDRHWNFTMLVLPLEGILKIQNTWFRYVKVVNHFVSIIKVILIVIMSKVNMLEKTLAIKIGLFA